MKEIPHELTDRVSVSGISNTETASGVTSGVYQRLPPVLLERARAEPGERREGRELVDGGRMHLCQRC